MENVLDNIKLPAPRWFRITKKIIYTLTSASIFTGTLTRMGVSESDTILIIGWLLLIGETLNEFLASSERYTKI